MDGPGLHEAVLVVCCEFAVCTGVYIGSSHQVCMAWEWEMAQGVIL